MHTGKLSSTSLSKFVQVFQITKFTNCSNDLNLRGKVGVPWVQIMENEFEYLADRGGHGG